ncbi:hypothetical protein EZ313_19630 [Ramlibacter henchirensis]|uniref:Uncharacterized protein n=1 Tax=Ramlibacter henchirensis TaxID=204072 RepID=A0A4Z0BQE5_9BURK|nr:hypothetical protein [Ramlibacter henchirensis]TFZ00664.1 hypothetical protein EZ313_19630 [Ramlibacter henchirensis]
MLHKLTGTKMIPLEREYEGWVVRGIQDYFEHRGQKVVIFAFSPLLEKDYPADEIMKLPAGYKGFGLQFKRPSSFATDSVRWAVDATQHKSIASGKSIFYALPTFANRDVYKEALQHCLFFHPTITSPWLGEPLEIFLDPKGNVTSLRLKQSKAAIGGGEELHGAGFALRWGAFIEIAERCHIGVKGSGFAADIAAHIARSKEARSESFQAGAAQPADSTLYLMAFKP